MFRLIRFFDDKLLFLDLAVLRLFRLFDEKLTVLDLTVLRQFRFFDAFRDPFKVKIVEVFRIRGPKMEGLRKLIVEENLRSKGAEATARPRDTDPGLPPHTPHVKDHAGLVPNTLKLVETRLQSSTFVER